MSPSAACVRALTLAIGVAALGCASTRSTPAVPRAAAPRPSDSTPTASLGQPLSASDPKPPERTPDPPTPTVREEHDVVYGKGGGESLKLDVYAPRDLAGPLPALVLIHGGGW